MGGSVTGVVATVVTVGATVVAPVGSVTTGAVVALVAGLLGGALLAARPSSPLAAHAARQTTRTAIKSWDAGRRGRVDTRAAR